MTITETAPRDADFATLLSFRDGLRRFNQWSQEQTKTIGVTPAQYQLMLAIRGHGSPPSIGDIAGHLLLRHHSVVELIDRATRCGLVERVQDPVDHRVVRLQLTEHGHERLSALVAVHFDEVSRLRLQLNTLFESAAAPD
jgi:DNA-binding MarR family transcriptional regulator